MLGYIQPISKRPNLRNGQAFPAGVPCNSTARQPAQTCRGPLRHGPVLACQAPGTAAGSPCQRPATPLAATCRDAWPVLCDPPAQGSQSRSMYCQCYFIHS